ncbi:MAG: hypothetical protein U0835_11865 [Isosphaeraceae bacterium]
MIEEYHQRWRNDPASVDESWRNFFEGFELAQSARIPRPPRRARTIRAGPRRPSPGWSTGTARSATTSPTSTPFSSRPPEARRNCSNPPASGSPRPTSTGPFTRS